MVNQFLILNESLLPSQLSQSRYPSGKDTGGALRDSTPGLIYQRAWGNRGVTSQASAAAFCLPETK